MMPGKTAKGKPGYYRYEKVKRCLVTLLMFAIPIGIFITGVIMTGTRKNLLTVVAILGVIPAARFAVSWIMVMMQKDVPEEVVAQTDAAAPDLVRAYELTVTAYEGQMPLDALVVCGNELVCFASNGKKDKIPMMQKHMAKILASNGYSGVNVKIFGEEKPFLDRVKAVAARPDTYREGIRFTPDSRYPDLSREEMILHTIMAISI